ncbi:hypothetical protein EVA_03777 [gut metagenome]|uniref:Uncharacterized protein n=1 Tax=gut metagenome TaxID=749906 RepID=J9GK41_9ZZZZ
MRLRNQSYQYRRFHLCLGNHKFFHCHKFNICLISNQ